MKTRILIETYGCAVNKADSEIIAGILERNGFKVSCPAESYDKIPPWADVVIVNTCTVKTPTERKILRRLRTLTGEKKKVVVCGCLPAAEPKIALEFPDASFIGVNISDIAPAVESTLRGESYVKITKPGDDSNKPCFPRVRQNPFIEIVQIARGCKGNCGYCITRKARGTLKSYPEDKILRQIKGAVLNGAKEIWLTAQDTGAYGKDGDLYGNDKSTSGKETGACGNDMGGTTTDLPHLLKYVSGIPGNFRVRAGMMNPNHAMEFLDDLIDAYRNKKIYKFLHIPVQSGDDSVLRDMGRRYTTDEFKEILRKFRGEFDNNITISTDVIAGFPTESEEAFQNTLELIKETKPDVLNVSRFWNRPGTKASGMKQLHGRVTKARSRKIAELFKNIALERNKEWVGWRGGALVSAKGKTSGFCARNSAYKPIIIQPGEADENLLGRFVNVKITDATYYDLRGEII